MTASNSDQSAAEIDRRSLLVGALLAPMVASPAAAAVTATAAAPAAVGVQVDARMVPFPKSISPEAQAALARMVGPSGRSLNLAPLPAADNVRGWIVAKRSLNRIFAEGARARLDPKSGVTVETIQMAGVTVHVATPPGKGSDDRIYVDLHGGGLVFGEGEACRLGARLAAERFGVRSFAIDYRTPPEHPYPAALDDCVNTYRALLERHAPRNIIVGGGSAGGNLAAALVLRGRGEGLPLPAALILATPEVDLTESGDTFETNRFIDVVLPQPLMPVNRLYAAGHDLAHPFLSPLFGDFTKGFPPTFLQSGTRDLFLSNTVRMHRALLKAKVPTELHIFEGMPHGGFMGAPEDAEVAAEAARFAAEHWGRLPDGAPRQR